jgi:hypothetical protein
MDMLTTLTKARELISDPARWTQGEYARDAKGAEVKPGSKYATCWCALGAVRKVTRRDSAAHGVLTALQKHCEGPTVTLFNDGHDHADVLAMFDRAIESAR